MDTMDEVRSVECAGDCGRRLPARDLTNGLCEECEAERVEEPGPVVVFFDDEETWNHLYGVWLGYPNTGQYEAMEAGDKPKHLTFTKELLNHVLQGLDELAGYFVVCIRDADDPTRPVAIFLDKGQAETWANGAYQHIRIDIHPIDGVGALAPVRRCKPQPQVPGLAEHVAERQRLFAAANKSLGYRSVPMSPELLHEVWLAYEAGRKSVIGELDPEDKG